MEKQTYDQQALLVAPAISYGWKPVQAVHKGDLLVIADQEVKVQGIKQDNGNWLLLTFTDPESGTKTEQLYAMGDSVYARR